MEKRMMTRMDVVFSLFLLVTELSRSIMVFFLFSFFPFDLFKIFFLFLYGGGRGGKEGGVIGDPLQLGSGDMKPGGERISLSRCG